VRRKDAAKSEEVVISYTKASGAHFLAGSHRRRMASVVRQFATRNARSDGRAESHEIMR
jgi:hypothetical protein